MAWYFNPEFTSEGFELGDKDFVEMDGYQLGGRYIT